MIEFVVIQIGVVAAFVLIVAMAARGVRRSRGSVRSGGDSTMTPWLAGGSSGGSDCDSASDGGCDGGADGGGGGD